MARTVDKARDMSRLRRFAQNNLGTIMTDQMNQGSDTIRKAELDELDRYYDGTQYEGLMDWESAAGSGDYVEIRKRKPRINYNLGKVLVNKVASKLVGQSAFPKFVIEEDPEDSQFFALVQKAANFRASMLDPIKKCLASGSVFVRYFFVNGAIHTEYALSKYCYPVFDAVGELESIEIKYVYQDENDKDGKGGFKRKWYRMLMDKTSDTLFDNPEYRPGSKPEFKIVEAVEHGLGWVQGEWLRTEKDKFDPDGYSIFGDILDFIDDFNYSLSQTSQAVSYNQEPQLAINGLDEDELDNLIKSSTKAWNLGKDGKAEYVGSDMDGIKAAQESREHFRMLMLEVVRIVLHDPEKMQAAAQSGKALEVLNGPLVELIDELRSAIENSLKNLLIKISLSALILNARGEDTVIQTPPGYQPSSLDITVQWPAMYPPTLADMAQMAAVCTALSTGKIVSRESLTRWVASQTNIIDNAEEELKKIASEPDLAPTFGSF